MSAADGLAPGSEGEHSRDELRAHEAAPRRRRLLVGVAIAALLLAAAAGGVYAQVASLLRDGREFQWGSVTSADVFGGSTVAMTIGLFVALVLAARRSAHSRARVMAAVLGVVATLVLLAGGLAGVWVIGLQGSYVAVAGDTGSRQLVANGWGIGGLLYEKRGDELFPLADIWVDDIAYPFSDGQYQARHVDGAVYLAWRPEADSGAQRHVVIPDSATIGGAGGSVGAAFSSEPCGGSGDGPESAPCLGPA
jgi:hypothetical protein